QRLASVEFSGRRWLPRDSLLSAIGIQAGDPWNSTAANQAELALRRHPFVERTSRAIERVENDGVHVTFLITPRRVIRAVRIQGADRFRSPDLEKKLLSQVGRPLRKDVLDRDRRLLLHAHHADGYLFAGASAETQELPNGGSDLTFVVRPGRRVRLRSMQFLGAESFSQRELIDAGGVKPARVFGVLESGLYLPGSIQDVVRAVDRHYRFFGYFDVRVELRDMRLGPRKREVFVEIDVSEGERYTVDAFRIQGAASFPEELLRRRVTLKTGELYDGEETEHSAEAIRDWYFDHSDLIANVNVKFDVDRKSRRVSVVFDVTEGGHFEVGRVEITGNRGTRDSVIRHRLGLVPGELYRPDELDDSRTRLNASQLFEDVKLTPIPREGESDLVDVHVDVDEKEETGRFEFGGGASSGAGEVAYVSISENNFDLFRIPKAWSDWEGAFRGGGQRLQVEIIPGTRESYYRFYFEEPYLYSAQNALAILHTTNLLQRETYDERRFTGDAIFRHFWNRARTFSCALAYRIDAVRIDDLFADAPAVVESQRGHTFFSYPRLSVRYSDLSYNRYAGARGTRAEVSLDIADRYTGADSSFVRVNAEADWYLTLFDRNPDRRHSFRLGAQFGSIRSTDGRDIPFFENFVTGGPRTFRGFDYRRVGPADGRTPLGGEILLRGTAEYSAPLYFRELRIAGFLDWGFLEARPNDVSFSRFRTAAGLGLQLRLPMPFTPQIVPLNFYFSQALRSHEGDVERFVSLTLGLGF
ncbi:MAG: outer membrane protein assembly factor BamA, partial [Planctomycetota bacterium]